MLITFLPLTENLQKVTRRRVKLNKTRNKFLKFLVNYNFRI